MVTWSESGNGPIDIDITCVRELAVSSGYVFEGEVDLAKLANLGAFFQNYGVTSLSGFKKLFYTQRLTASGRKEPQERSSWVQQGFDGEHFEGEILLGGLRQGLGRLKYQVGKSDATYLGQFERGVKEGFGVLIAISGHRYEGQFENNVICGHGVFLFPSTTVGCDHERPAKFEGCFNGKPCGKGIYILCNGRQDYGIFDGTLKTGEADLPACTAAAALGRGYAEAARKVQRQVESELQRRRQPRLLLEAPIVSMGGAV